MSMTLLAAVVVIVLVLLMTRNGGGALILILLLGAALAAVLLFSRKTVVRTSGPGIGAPMSVGLVTPGAINDGGWNQSAYDGLQRIQKELMASVSSTVAQDGSASEAFAAFRDFGSRNTRLIIGHASEWFDPQALAIAAQHPDSVYVISGSERAEGNMVGARYLLEDACYVLGQVAGGMSRSGVIGCVGPVKIPVIESTFFAFAEGAKSVRKDIRVEIVWTNDWADVARAKERTLILLDQKADFIFHNANNGAPGVFQAVQERRQKGADVYVFGANADQNALAPDVILASAVLDIPAAFVQIAKKVSDGSFKREAQFLGMTSGIVRVAYNPALKSKVPENVLKLADATVARILSGEVKVPRLELK